MTFFAIGNEFDSPGQEAAFRDLCWAEADILHKERPQLGLFGGPNVVPEYGPTRAWICLGRTEPLSRSWDFNFPETDLYGFMVV